MRVRAATEALPAGFTSDNGWFFGEHRRSEKVLAYKEAARVPLYFVLPESDGMQTRSNLVVNNDLAPTILELASPGYSDADFDGRSFAPLLESATPPQWTDRTQFLLEFGRTSSGAGNVNTYIALRNRTRLYVESYSGLYQQTGFSTLNGLELYDLPNDPHEMNSLLHHPEHAPDPVLGPWLHLLHGCVMQSCKQYENAIAP